MDRPPGDADARSHLRRARRHTAPVRGLPNVGAARARRLRRVLPDPREHGPSVPDARAGLRSGGSARNRPLQALPRRQPELRSDAREGPSSSLPEGEARPEQADAEGGCRMSENARVTVMIGVYNGARYLGEAIDSVLAQTRPVHELIVVDDGSTDGSGEIARSYGASVRCVRQERGGMAAARNRAIEDATGDFFAFLDADDRFPPEKL